MLYNYTLDSPSPVLTYSANWSPVVASDDTSLSSYNNGTAMKTGTTGASVSYFFNGTGIWVYGSKRWNHGEYSVIVDTDELTASGQSDDDQFQTLLYGMGNLTYGPHEITITNRGFSNHTDGFLDIDFITWESSLPDKSVSHPFTSTDQAFEYLPGPNWWSWGPDNKSYSGRLYYTQSTQAAFRFNFTGQSVGLYGYLDTNHGNYSCTVDGVKRTGKGDYSGYYPSKAYQQLVCFADDLNEDNHSLVVENLPLSTNDGWFSIDYAEVWGDHVSRAVNKSHSTNLAGPIAGGVVGGLLFLALLGALFFFYVRRRQRRADGGRPVANHDNFEVDPFPTTAVSEAFPSYHTHVSPFPVYRDDESTEPDRSSYQPSESYAASRPPTLVSLMPHNNDVSPRSSTVPSDPLSKRALVLSESSGSSSRYLAPQAEMDAGPLLGSLDEDDEEETRAVSGPTLPPMYSSLAAGPSGLSAPQQATLRDEKPVVRSSGGLYAVGGTDDHDVPTGNLTHHEEERQ